MLVTTPDRLARNYVHQMVLLEEWARAGCLVEFLDRPMSDDPHDHLLLQIRGAVAEYERTRRGRLAKLRAGLLLAWTYPPYGYRLDPDRPRDPRGVMTDPAEAAIVAELFALYREPGTSLMQLARHLDQRGVPTPSGRPWSSPTIRGILRNPTYTGQVYAQRTRYRARRTGARRRTPSAADTARPPLCPPRRGCFLSASARPRQPSAFRRGASQAGEQSRLRAAEQHGAPVLVARIGELRGRRGLACTARAVNGRSFYYLCNGKGQSTYSHRALRCAARYIPAKQLDELVWQDLCALLREPAPLAAAVARAQEDVVAPGAARAPRDAAPRPSASAPTNRAAHRRLPSSDHPAR